MILLRVLRTSILLTAKHVILLCHARHAEIMDFEILLGIETHHQEMYNVSGFWGVAGPQDRNSRQGFLTCFHASFFPFCPFCWPPLFLSFSRHFYPLFLHSKNALFCRGGGTAETSERGSSRIDLLTKFGKEIPSRNLREKRSGFAPSASSVRHFRTGYCTSTSHALQGEKRSEKEEGVSHPIGHVETPKNPIARNRGVSLR